MVLADAAVRCAAGDLDALVALLHERGTAFSASPPYPSEGLGQPRCARVEPLDRDRPCRDLLLEVVGQVLIDPARTGLVVGTSSGHISGPWERWHRAELAGESKNEGGTWRQSPTVEVAEALGIPRHTTVSVACASGTVAFALADGWLRDHPELDHVIVAGVDALSLYIHAGFNGLGALTASTPRPFSAERDGLLLGEGAAALRVSRTGEGPELLGVGLSGDAVHMTAPDREGRGCARGLRAALADAQRSASEVDLVSVHGTGTNFNDNMEAHALAAVFPEGVPLFGVKHAIGHTLGAAGAIEAAVAWHAWTSGRVPPGPANVALDLPLKPLPPVKPRRILSTNSAFGGANASVLFGAGPAPRRAPREAVQTATTHVRIGAGKVDWAAFWPDPPERFKRMNRYVRLGWLAAYRLLLDMPQPEHMGIVLASESNCRHVDLRYHTKLVRRGAAGAPRVDFIYTIPGAPVGEISIHWGLRGPQLSLAAPGHEADAEAERLIRWGRADRLMTLAIEAPDANTAGVATAALWECG